MNLREFISQTLVDIQGGVNDAIHKSHEGKIPGAINPVWGGHEKAGRDDLQIVNFDVAVMASESENADVGGGIKVLGIGMDGKTTGSSESSRTTRIQFTVPIILPVYGIYPGVKD